MNLSSIMRPKTLDEVIGNEATVASLRKQLETDTLPQTLMFTGGFGQGKTTLGRILADSLGAEITEVDCGSAGNVDNIRQIVEAAGMSSLFHDKKVFILDEVHKLSAPAQSALLKTLEDSPNSVYFILLTDQPQKVLKTILSRCVVYTMTPATNADVGIAVGRVQEKYGLRFEDKKDFWAIINQAEGSLRVVYSLMEKLISVADDAGFVSSEAFQGIIGKAEEEVDENLPKAFLAKDVKTIFSALKAAKDNNNTAYGTALGVYNYIKAGTLAGWAKGNNRGLLNELASLPKDCDWLDIEAIVWRNSYG